MCNKAVYNYCHILEFVPEYYETQKMCDRAVHPHPSTIKYVSESHKTQKMSDKALHRRFLYLILFLISIKLYKCVKEIFLNILS